MKGNWCPVQSNHREQMNAMSLKSFVSLSEAGDTEQRRAELRGWWWGWGKTLGCSEVDTSFVSLFIERLRLRFSEMSRESYHCIYVDYDRCLCPRHDDCSDPLYLSTPNSQIKTVGFGDFKNSIYVAESNSCPYSSSASDHCAVSASFPVYPTCSSVFCLTPTCLNCCAVLKYEKQL